MNGLVGPTTSLGRRPDPALRNVKSCVGIFYMININPGGLHGNRTLPVELGGVTRIVLKSMMLAVLKAH